MKVSQRKTGQARLLALVGALVVLTITALVLHAIEPSHDPAELDGDPDGEYFEAVGFAISCLLALAGYGLVIAFSWRRLSRLPVLIPPGISASAERRSFAPNFAVGAAIALNEVWILLAAVILVGLAVARLRRCGAAWTLGMVAGALCGAYLSFLYGVATP